MTPQLLHPPHLKIAPKLSSVLTRQLNRADHITTKLAISFKHQDYFHTRLGPHPTEIQLERRPKDNHWHLCLIASFAYEDPASSNLDVELLFDSIKRQFYQPDIGYCEIEQPEVQRLFQAWQSAFLSHLDNHQFDEINLTIMKYHIDTTDNALCIKP
ncbi:DUF2787 domain-containing protein [Vibrio parahaemolyticus]|uniref:DUF2787 family protein n=1 Tax=Vibrio parahaemolyticus TaxID=670 RepID=UPI001594D0D0|nr:DUF2787 family protein [Vibrio parahaemolyticus]EKA7363831.1 DUF2787 family protein [Vibrio parahaemolyticus]NVC26295.1 DUF2787 domain-containing protein [Vibrio parahaemolyticus]